MRDTIAAFFLTGVKVLPALPFLSPIHHIPRPPCSFHHDASSLSRRQFPPRLHPLSSWSHPLRGLEHILTCSPPGILAFATFCFPPQTRVPCRAGLKSLSKRDRQQRIKDLRRLRVLESYYTSKCRRIRKIKSKKFRKYHKKQQEKNGDDADGGFESLTAAQQEALDPERAADMQLKSERARALNRASLRHKNTSKWAKQMLKRKHLDDGTKKALSEQLIIDRDLRKKVTLEKDSDDSDHDSDSEGPVNHRLKPKRLASNI